MPVSLFSTSGLSGLLGLLGVPLVLAEFGSFDFQPEADLTSSLPSILFPLMTAAAVGLSLLANKQAPVSTSAYGVVDRTEKPLLLPESDQSFEYFAMKEAFQLPNEPDLEEPSLDGDFDALLESFAQRLDTKGEGPRQPAPEHLRLHLVQMARGR